MHVHLKCGSAASTQGYPMGVWDQHTPSICQSYRCLQPAINSPAPFTLSKLERGEAAGCRIRLAQQQPWAWGCLSRAKISCHSPVLSENTTPLPRGTSSSSDNQEYTKKAISKEAPLIFTNLITSTMTASPPFVGVLRSQSCTGCSQPERRWEMCHFEDFPCKLCQPCSLLTPHHLQQLQGGDTSPDLHHPNTVKPAFPPSSHATEAVPPGPVLPSAGPPPPGTAQEPQQQRRSGVGRARKSWDLA